MAKQTSAPYALDAVKRARIVARLLEWYRVHKRDLPWRGASPYAVWVSEIMLQQTQVATVIPFYLRFLERFPTVEALAAAPIEEVLKYWAGLGYYARARNLHRAAQKVVAEFGGRVPETPEAIESLPGIGRYTAGAILSMAYNRPRPLVDANVIRVLSRVFGLRGDPKSGANQAALWSLAEQLVPEEAPGDFNQGLMELGALVCEPAEPKCERCPLLADCVAGNSPDPSALPEIPPGRAAVAVTHSAAFIRDEAGRVLIAQRPLHGLWGGLWEFPRVVCAHGESPQEGAARAAREVVGLEVAIGARIGKVKHGVTHHRITLYGFAARPLVSDAVPQPLDCAAVRWEPLDALDGYAFSSSQVLLRNALLTHEATGNVQTALSFEE
jgi:A/G-specific adenine glycosylase